MVDCTKQEANKEQNLFGTLSKKNEYQLLFQVGTAAKIPLLLGSDLPLFYLKGVFVAFEESPWEISNGEEHTVSTYNPVLWY